MISQSYPVNIYWTVVISGVATKAFDLETEPSRQWQGDVEVFVQD